MVTIGDWAPQDEEETGLWIGGDAWRFDPLNFGHGFRVRPD